MRCNTPLVAGAASISERVCANPKGYYTNSETAPEQLLRQATFDPAVMGGRAFIRGWRMTVGFFKSPAA
jgi:hypothetical protein